MKKNNHRPVVRSFLFAAIAASALFGCTKKTPQDEILIGQVAAMTGDAADFGISTDNGVKLAFQEINAAGGINGKKLKLITLDDQNMPEQAAMATTRLITQNHVTAILGEFTSSTSIAMGPVAQQYKVPMISSGATNPKVTQAGDYVFRTCFIDPFQGKVMAKFALDKLKAKNVAVFRDVKNDYSVGLADFFTQTFKAGGGKIVIDQSYGSGDFDFKAQLTAIRGQNPDAIFVPGNYGDVALIMRQKAELGIKVPLLGGDGWDSPKLAEISGAGFEGNYFSNHYSPTNTDPAVVKFVETYKKTYGGATPSSMAALGYDAAYVLADALKRSKSLSGSDLRDAILATKDFPGVTGKISIDKDRNAVKSAVVLKTTAGKYQFETTVSPEN